MDTMFLAPIPMIEDADQTVREIKDEIDRIARVEFGPGSATIIAYMQHWSVTIYGPRIHTMMEVRHACLLDALHDLRKQLTEKQQHAAMLAATLGIEPAEDEEEDTEELRIEERRDVGQFGVGA